LYIIAILILNFVFIEMEKDVACLDIYLLLLFLALIFIKA
jgi:hypothetical protein